MKRIKLLIISALICVLSNAQTLQQGRNYFLQGDYEKAKPIMLKYLKQKPDDASRNYWYGICCMETGEKDKAIPYLEKAASKKIFKAYRALGQYYEDREDYQPAITNYEAFVKGISSDKELHDVALEDSLTHATDSLKVLFRMLRNTSRVCFIDSFRVSKNELFSTYIIGESTGSFYPSSAFFEDDSEGEVFLPETGQNILYSRMTPQGVFRFYTKFKSFDRWTDETPVSGLETDGDLRYPFLQNDGVTIYYAASGSESMGGLDIFVSRYNTATGKYLKPENIGMPFNSEANDYLYVIDEDNNLGWFATDRRQPKDTVCVYVFIRPSRTSWPSVPPASASRCCAMNWPKRASRVHSHTSLTISPPIITWMTSSVPMPPNSTSAGPNSSTSMRLTWPNSTSNVTTTPTPHVRRRSA